jgi:glutathione S-transferase
MTASPASAATAVVQVRRVIAAPREEVFRAWTDPELFRQWFRPTGGSSPSAEMDVRVGGRYRVAMKPPGLLYHAFGEYLEVHRPERLVFTLGWESVPLVELTDSVVTVELAERGDGTEVVITHERLPTRPLRGLHRGGWRSCLRKLDRLLAAQTR